MSVLIRDMDKPEKCGECKFFHILNLDSWCCVTDERIEDEFGVLPDDCPLVEIKTPHGRLIDADKAYDTMVYEMCGTGFQSRASSVLESEFYTPTVIEAEGAEE